jgi:hypothetical protein
MNNSGLFLPSLWAKSIAQRFSQNLVLAEAVSMSAFWMDWVPVDEDLGPADSRMCQACMFI